MVEVDFDLLKEEGYLVKEETYDDLGEALLAYQALYMHLSVAEDVLYGDEGESFAFKLHITITSPYIITTQIDLI